MKVYFIKNKKEENSNTDEEKGIRILLNRSKIRIFELFERNLSHTRVWFVKL